MSTWPEVLGALVARTDLTAEQASWAMGDCLLYTSDSADE